MTYLCYNVLIKELDQTDYRAWYGMAQTYEMLEMHYYAIYYYQQATTYRPMDWRMWQGLGNCYYKLKRYKEAIKAFKRALLSDSTDSAILINLAEIYISDGDFTAGEQYYRQCFREELEEYSMLGGKAALWLARVEKKRCRWIEVEKYVDYALKGSYELEEVKTIKKACQNAMQTIESE